jgi:glycosyltransferase involved in cell wall biosynthesis
MSNFNGSRFINQTIESVLSQTCTDWEFIIVDDCSTDDSREIIDSYHDNRVVKLYLDHHEHMVYAFNLAISHSSGYYIARIDNDDTWKPEKLEKQLKYMETHPECGACFSLVNIVDENENILTEKETERVRWMNTGNRTQAQWLRQFFFNGSCLCHTSVLMRREIINTVGLYNYSLIQIQDFDLWVRIAKKYPLYVIQEVLGNYRWITSGGNVSAPSLTTTRRSNYEFFYVLSRYFDDIPDEMLIEAFGGDFIRKGTTNHEELLCERAFLLLKGVFCGHIAKLEGMAKLVDLLQDDGTREILRDKYYFSQLNFYELSASPVFYEESAASTPAQRGSFLAWLKNILKKNQKLYNLLRRILSLV